MSTPLVTTMRAAGFATVNQFRDELDELDPDERAAFKTGVMSGTFDYPLTPAQKFAASARSTAARMRRQS